MKKLGGVLLAGLMVASLAGSAGAKPVSVFKDAAGDAGLSSQGQPIPGFDQAGFDLVGGGIEQKGANLEFTVTHSAMPPNGALPEGFRLMWHFGVGTDQYRFTIKSADIGKPDPLSGPNGTERIGQVNVDGVFRLETIEDGASLGLPVTTPIYTVIANLDGAFDPAAKTITFVLPMKIVKAKKGSVVSGGTAGASDTDCMICWIPQYAERSLTPHTVIDSAVQTVSYKVK